MQPRTPTDLQAYLTAHDIPAQIIQLTAETPTVAAAAEALGVNANQVVKTVIFFVDGQPFAVLANGVRRVDPRKIAAHFNVSRKKVRLADGDAVLKLTGYAPGTVPPFGHVERFPALMALEVREQEIVYAGGGGIAAMLKIASAELLALTGATLLYALEAASTTNPDEDSPS